MSDEQKSNYQTMKEIAPYTKLTPEERMGTTERLINNLNGPDFDIGRPRNVVGYQLDDPEVILASKNVFRAKDGSLNFKDKVKQAVNFKDWVIVYSQGKNSSYDDQDADNLSALINEAAKAFGISFSTPGFITCDNNINSWKKEIQKDVEKNGKPQIIVLFFNNNEEKFYGELKRYITCELKLPSQGIKRKTVGSKSKSPMSAASKIIIQMNQKVGGVTWEVIRGSYFAKKKCMYGAFSISKGKRGFTLAFVGTLNPENTKIFNSCKTGYKRKEEIPKADFDAIFMNWAKNYVMENKEGPNIIVIYREGLSIPQIEVQLKPEIDALNSVIKKIAEKTKKANYHPEVMYITVNKKINTRIFDTPDRVGSQGKFTPRVFNPSSGTCVFEEISVDKQLDFHLTAQKVTQGTCTPTHYIVVYNDSNIPQESLAQFTYEQCFNYYNWQGAVKVPAALQCADKLAKLVGESIQANVTEGDVTKSFYFL
jgi:aubergine-like protein